jgi:nucleoside-diphosphate-sugar epimerase
MNKIIVFGGAGRTGSEVVKKCLNEGYKVTAFAYSEPNKDLLPAHDNLSIYLGDAKNFDSVAHAITGHDIVINIIAPKLFDAKNYPISEIATKNIIDAMKKHGVRRYIGQAGAWATDQLRDASPLMQLGFIFFLPLRHLYAYKKKEDAIVKASGLDWTLVRCGLLTNKQTASEYQIHNDRYTCGFFEIPKIRRVNVADFEVRIINDNTYFQKCPIIIE